jgi:hypothetical protein
MKKPSQSQKILRDHKQQGKIFVTPFNDMDGPHAETDWISQTIPEIIWIAILNHRVGIKITADWVSHIVNTIGKNSSNNEGVPNLPFSFISSYSKLEVNESLLHKIAENPTFQIVARHLKEFLVMFPECPLKKVFPPLSDSSYPSANAIVELKVLLERLFDKTSIESTFAQAAFVYSEFTSGRLLAEEGNPLADFPAILDYPSTDESRRVASSIRRYSTMVTSILQQKGLGDWPRYFWQTYYEMEPATI